MLVDPRDIGVENILVRLRWGKLMVKLMFRAIIESVGSVIVFNVLSSL